VNFGKVIWHGIDAVDLTAHCLADKLRLIGSDEGNDKTMGQIAAMQEKVTLTKRLHAEAP
jgi:hypothetical protein